jgi:O-antigen/teichoic acid export membrane protein
MSAATEPGKTGSRGLAKTVASLLGTTGITSVLGVVFWAVATHRASMTEVGNGAAAVSAMALIGTFGMAGMNTALIPHLVRRPQEAGGLLAAALTIAGALSALLAAGFWVIAAIAGHKVAPYLHGPQAAIFLIGAAMTGAGLVLDEALLGILGGTPQLWRNTVFAVSKLGAVALLTAIWHDQFGTPILTAWTVGTAASLVVTSGLLTLRGVRLLSRPRWRALRHIGRETAANTWLNNALLAPVLLTPTLVIGLLHAADGGAFYVASTVMTTAIMLTFHFTTALYASSANDPGGLAAKLRFSLRVCLLGGLVAIPLIVLAAHPLLHVFGAQYAARAAVPLEVMIGGYLGSVLKNHYIAVCRVQRRVTRAAVFATVSCAARLIAITAGALAGGLVGVSVALLVVMTAEGCYALPALRSALHPGPHAAKLTARYAS